MFRFGTSNKNSVWKKAGQRKLQREGIRSASSVGVKDVNVFKRTALTKEDWLILHISPDDGLNSNWLSGQKRKIGHLQN